MVGHADEIKWASVAPGGGSLQPEDVLLEIENKLICLHILYAELLNQLENRYFTKECAAINRQENAIVPSLAYTIRNNILDALALTDAPLNSLDEVRRRTASSSAPASP